MLEELDEELIAGDDNFFYRKTEELKKQSLKSRLYQSVTELSSNEMA